MISLLSLPSALIGLSRSSLLYTSPLRFLSASPPARDKDGPHRIYVSTSTDPWFNLAFENWLYRKSNPLIPMLFMYRNRESVILGRNQNPWKEANLPLLESRGIPFVRRRSGGGTVYHDLGNTNYSVLIPNALFERRPNAELVARALNSLGVNALVNERNDITLDGFKISGSAYKLNNRRAYHHGTMLIDAKLAELGESLRSTRSFTTNKGTASVPSPVQNISTHHLTVTHDCFVDAVVEEFTRVYGDGDKGVRFISQETLSSTDSEKEEVEKEAKELKSWSWSHGQTPEFSIDLARGDGLSASITSKHGLVTGLSFSPTSPALQRLAQSLLGKRFGEIDEVEGEEGAESHEMREVRRWLRKEM